MYEFKGLGNRMRLFENLRGITGFGLTVLCMYHGLELGDAFVSSTEVDKLSVFHVNDFLYIELFNFFLCSIQMIYSFYMEIFFLSINKLIKNNFSRQDNIFHGKCQIIGSNSSV